MEQPRKKIGDLTLEEALKESDGLKLRKKQIDVTIADFKEKKAKLKSDKARIKDSKSIKMKALQDTINKTASKTAKDFKRKSKVRESESFDSQIKSKTNRIGGKSYFGT